MKQILVLIATLGAAVTAFVAIQAPAQAATTRTWVSVTVGGTHTCAIRDNRAKNLYCWGSNAYGQLGTGDTAPRSRPVKIGARSWRAVEAGDLQTCAITTGRKLFCTGYNNGGLLGTGDVGPVDTLQQVGTQRWLSVSAGFSHICAVRDNRNRDAYCWGSNSNGQTGNLGVSPTSPRKVARSLSWATVTAGRGHTCGLTRGRQLFCWGDNSGYQLGIGTRAGDDNRSDTPRRVGTRRDWTSVSTSRDTTCGVRANQRAYCWGRNEERQAGDGGTSDRPSPTAVVGSKKWRGTAAATTATCGVRDNRKLMCWGEGSAGQLGTGNEADRAAPRQEARKYDNWRSVTGGTSHMCGIRTNHKLHCWGAYGLGGLGVDGGSHDRLVPTLVR